VLPSDQIQATARGRPVTGNAADRDPVQAVYGVLRFGQSTDDAMRALRGEPDAV
jgi:hypothetical protein